MFSTCFKGKPTSVTAIAPPKTIIIAGGSKALAEATEASEDSRKLGRQAMARMACAGVAEIQPGIESFSSNTLRMMNKGATSLQQVNLLKWAKAYGVTVRYPILVSSLDVNPHATRSFPPQKIPNGHCFVLGDNRKQSEDSRVHGPVPLTDVVGRVEKVF